MTRLLAIWMLTWTAAVLADPEEKAFIWPGRLSPEHAEQANGLIIEDDRPITGWRGARVPNDMRLTPYPIETQQFEAFKAWLGEELTPKFEPGGGFIVIPMLDENQEPDGKQHFVFYSAQAGEKDGEAELQRTWFTYDEPENAEPVGLAIVMPGMFATPRDVNDRAERGLLNENWAVLRMLAPPSRMTQRVEYVINSVDPDPVVKEIAADLDNRAAEAAYAVHAAAAHAHTINPALTNRPRVIIGMSGTAIALPTIVAYEPDAYDAAVFIGGGALSYIIAVESSYRDWIDSIQIFTISAEEKALVKGFGENTFDDEYASYSTLDGVHTARAMQDIPILMIHGSRDTAVPAATGDLLWEKLGQPERWVMPVGHELLFGAMPLRMVGVLDWLEREVLESGSP